MRRLVATSVLLACSGLVAGCALGDALDGAPTADETPATQEAPRGGSSETLTTKTFRIKMPCAPARTQGSIPVPGQTASVTSTWMCERDDALYAVSTAVIPGDLPFDIDGAAQGAAASTNGMVVAKSSATVAGAPARDLRISTTNNGEPAMVFLRVVQRDRTLFQVQAVVVLGNGRPPSHYRKMVESLSFRGR